MVVVGGKDVWCGLSSGGVCIYRDGVLVDERDEGHLGPITCIAWSERAGLVWTGGGDCKLLSWSVKDHSRVGVLGGHKDWIRCLLVSSGKLWSGGDDATVCVWPEDGNEVAPLTVIRAHQSSVLCLVRAGAEVWSGSSDHQICRMSETGKELGFLVGQTGRVMAMAASAQHCWAGCSDKRCVIWSTKSHRQLGEDDSFSGSVGVILLVDGWCIWTGTGDGVIRCWVGEIPPPMAWIPGRAPPVEPVTVEVSEKKGEPETEESLQLDAADDDEVLPMRSRRARRQKAGISAAGVSPISAKKTPASSSSPFRPEKPSLEDDLDSPRVEEPPSSLESSLEHGMAAPAASSSRRNVSSRANQSSRHTARDYEPSPPPPPRHHQPPSYSQAHSVHMQPPPPQPMQAPWWYGQQPPIYPPQQQMMAAPQPNSIVHVIAPPVAPPAQSPGTADSMAFIAHLRETNLQLRNAYSSLSEKHDLLREQHHRQLVRVEEDHQSALERQRQELELKHERSTRDLQNERVALERKFEVSQAELARVRGELESLKASQAGSSRVDEERLRSSVLEESLRVVQQQQQQLLQTLASSSPARHMAYAAPASAVTTPMTIPQYQQHHHQQQQPQQQQQQPPPPQRRHQLDPFDLNHSLEEVRQSQSSIEEMRRLNAQVLARARQLGRK